MRVQTVNNVSYQIIKLLGKGKGGYSYLALDGDKKVVLKQIHHEPCDYYAFGNKIEAEINDYHRLKNIGITVPRMIDVDIQQERIVKEYINGKTVCTMCYRCISHCPQKAITLLGDEVIEQCRFEKYCQETSE